MNRTTINELDRLLSKRAFQPMPGPPPPQGQPPMGQPPMDPSMMGGQPPMPPMGQPPMDPYMMGGQPPMPPGQPPMGQPPMDPAMMGAGQPPQQGSPIPPELEQFLMELVQQNEMLMQNLSGLKSEQDGLIKALETMSSEHRQVLQKVMKLEAAITQPVGFR